MVNEAQTLKLRK